jgi:pimeloyl-ACP methyl ester carboxylesterase
MTGGLDRRLERVQGAISGLLGATLPREMRRPGEMQLRWRGQRFAPAELAQVVRRQPPRKDVVFLNHGLMRDESCWHAASFDMAGAFEADLDVIAVDVRYDSGRPVSENGRDLAALLEALFTAVGEIRGRWHIVAHSMGGLVSRSGLHQAEQAGMTFTRSIDRVVLLGTPNRGARLEQGVEMAAVALELALPVLRTTARGVRGLLTCVRVGKAAPLAPVAAMTDLFVEAVPSFFVRLAGRVLDLRSDGIRDLRHGRMLREEGEQRPRGLERRRRPVPPPPGARTYAVAGSLSKRTGGTRLARATDGLVSAASAANAGDDELRITESGRFRLLPGVGHLAMPRSREVYRTLRGWFAEDAEPRESAVT